jgi:hypothetical protein
MGDTKRTNFHQRICRWFGPFLSGPFFFFFRSAGSFCFAHRGILAEKWERLAFPSTAIFSRFPNKNPEKPTLVKNNLATLTHFSRRKIFTHLAWESRKPDDFMRTFSVIFREI